MRPLHVDANQPQANFDLVQLTLPTLDASQHPEQSSSHKEALRLT
ncbi:hypothetical protein BN381_580003 [Candidatus Microthrix parvicella RN1]|uniref:Uncharacterized protein n=1 Tax=Candidatus Neomicrothrix parvicella RN1 TaxID=1229780 RepID=R4Z676_9ACTN|nr:hypothetical protein BN381_580003 [Candidatus Microthrix parvicella RN1]